MRQINKIIIHCSDSNFGNAVMIDGWHKDRQWDGIGYHFVILNGYGHSSTEYIEAMDGQVEYGRALKKAGAHVKGHNSDSIGICLIGQPNGKDGKQCKFSHKQLAAVKQLCLNLMLEHSIPIMEVYGHYEFDSKKICPGMPMDLFRNYLMNNRDETLALTSLLNALRVS
jgi:hypothetical protein